MGQHGVQGHAPRLPVAIPAPALRCGRRRLCPVHLARQGGPAGCHHLAAGGRRPGWEGALSSVARWPLSSTTRPSRRVMMRSAWLATAMSWVTRMMGGPWACSSGGWPSPLCRSGCRERRWFVRQDHPRRRWRAPGNTDPLLLTAGELAWSGGGCDPAVPGGSARCGLGPGDQGGQCRHRWRISTLAAASRWGSR